MRPAVVCHQPHQHPPCPRIPQWPIGSTEVGDQHQTQVARRCFRSQVVKHIPQFTLIFGPGRLWLAKTITEPFGERCCAAGNAVLSDIVASRAKVYKKAHGLVHREVFRRGLQGTRGTAVDAEQAGLADANTQITTCLVAGR